MKTQRIAREAAPLLVKRRDVLSVARDFATNFATMQKTLVKCGFFACRARAQAIVSSVADRACEHTKRREDMRVTARNRCAKFFSTASLNRPLQELIAIGIERITLERFADTRPNIVVATRAERRKRAAEGPLIELREPIRILHAAFDACRMRERRAAGGDRCPVSA